MSANAVFQPLHMRRMYRPFRGQVRSHKIQFLQWLTGYLIRADLSAKRPVHPMNIHRLNYSIRGQTERRPVRSHKNVFIQQITGCLIRGDLQGIGSKNLHTRCVRCNLGPLRSPSLPS